MNYNPMYPTVPPFDYQYELCQQEVARLEDIEKDLLAMYEEAPPKQRERLEEAIALNDEDLAYARCLLDWAANGEAI